MVWTLSCPPHGIHFCPSGSSRRRCWMHIWTRSRWRNWRRATTTANNKKQEQWIGFEIYLHFCFLPLWHQSPFLSVRSADTRGNCCKHMPCQGKCFSSVITNIYRISSPQFIRKMWPSTCFAGGENRHQNTAAALPCLAGIEKRIDGCKWIAFRIDWEIVDMKAAPMSGHHIND